MGAVKDALIAEVEAIMTSRGIPASDGDAFEAIEEYIMGGGVGYACKPYGEHNLTIAADGTIYND